MGFILKQLLTGALAMGFVNERLENHEWQTIDRERGIVLKKVSGPGPDSYFKFNLIFEGEGVNFSAYQKMKQLKDGDEIEWQVLEIYAPSHIKQDKSRLHELITEALDAYGFASSRKFVKNLIVTFSPNI
ncbi:MAG: hypothetical protein KBA82_12205 [Nitrosomonas sp.]|nr:hypothetical protein [Nitrosomonas sp.]MBP7113694.1 hypothetical protein [Nitrosomonas sp.]